MVWVKPEPSTQGNQGASTPLLNTHSYILTSKTMNPNPKNLDPNSQIMIKSTSRNTNPETIKPNTLLPLARTTSGPHPSQPVTLTPK